MKVRHFIFRCCLRCQTHFPFFLSFFFFYQLRQHPSSQSRGAAAGDAPVYTNSFFSPCHPRIKLTFNFQSGHLGSFEGSLMALLAKLRRQSLWLVQVPVHNCNAHHRKLIHFNGSCVFLFVRSAIANCWSFSSSLKGNKRHTVTHRGVAAPNPPPPPPEDSFPGRQRVLQGCGLLTYGLSYRGQSIPLKTDQSQFLILDSIERKETALFFIIDAQIPYSEK